MWTWMKHWLGPGVKTRPDLHFVLFSRQGCHLCTTTWTQLSAWQAIYRFTLKLEDVDTNPSWVAQYGHCVPVVEINGKARFRGNVNEVLLRRLLEARGD